MTARTLMALLALACAGCSRETPRTYYLVRESGLYAQRGHLLVTDFKMRLADTTVWGERLMAVSPGIVVLRDTDDTLRGADAVRFLFPREPRRLARDTSYWQHNVIRMAPGIYGAEWDTTGMAGDTLYVQPDTVTYTPVFVQPGTTGGRR